MHTLQINPIRRRRRLRHHLRRIRHSYARNPRNFLSGITRETLIPASIGAGGAIALDVLYAYAQPHLPQMLQSGPLPIVVKLAGAVGLGLLAGKMLGRKNAEIITLGAVTVVGYGAIKGALSTALPSIPGLSGYQDYVDYSVGARPMGAYMHGGTMGFLNPAPMLAPANSASNLGAYMTSTALAPANALHGLNALGDGGYDWRNDGM